MTTQDPPVPTTVQRAAIRVCRDALHWRDDVRAIFVAGGVPRSVYDKYDDPSNGKAKIARYIFDELTATGDAGHAVLRKIVEELCRMSGPHPDAPDQHAGSLALADLKREATAARVLVDPERSAAEARRAAGARKAAAIEERRTKLGELRHAFLALHRPMTAPERQSRGYQLERLLASLFRLDDLEYRPSYRTNGEQIDGSFHFRGFTYLVEARWRADAPSAGDLLSFKGKVDSKIDSTRGVYVSMVGYDQAAVDHVVRMARGSRNNIIMFDGRDISLLFEGSIGLVDALTAKIDAAEQEGLMWQPLQA